MDGDQLAQKLSLEMARQVFNQYKYFNYLFQNMFEQCDQSHSTMSKDFTIQKLQAICYLISPQFQKIYLGISLNDDYLEIHKGQHSERIMLGDHLNFQILRLHTQQTRIQYSNINPGYANKNKKTLGKALGLKFQSLNEDKSVKFYFQNSDEINLWINLLQNKMNQSNFNREINIIKKIKNGVHATFYYGQRVETQERVLVKAYSKERMISENTFGNYLQQVSTMRSFVQKNWLKFCLIYQSSQAYYIVMQESFAHEMINSCSFSILRGIPQNLPSSGKLQKEFNNIVSQVIDAQRENLRENLSLGRKKSGFQKSSKNFQILNHHQPLGKLVN